MSTVTMMVIADKESGLTRDRLIGAFCKEGVKGTAITKIPVCAGDKIVYRIEAGGCIPVGQMLGVMQTLSKYGLQCKVDSFGELVFTEPPRTKLYGYTFILIALYIMATWAALGYALAH